MEVSARASEIDALLLQIKVDAQTAQDLREQVQKSVQEIQTLEVAQHYSGQADGHRKSAKGALWVVAVLAVVLAVGGALFIQSIPRSASCDWTQFAREVLIRAFVLGAVSYGVVFAARIYRTSKHLQAVYDQKATALKTFVVFSQTVDDADARTLILAELVRSVFSAADTGVLDKGGTDHTIIDSVPSVAAALTAARGKG